MQMLKRTRPGVARRPDRAGGAGAAGADPGRRGAPLHRAQEAPARGPRYQVPYEHPSLEPVLRDTLGAIVFQDQVIEVAMAFAGFSAGRGRGPAAGDEPQALGGGHARLRGEVRRGRVRANGASREVAERVYAQIVGFSGFGFPKAHSAAFGLLAYQSTWLRVHYEPEFLCSLLNEQPMGFYPPDTLVHEAQRRGIEVLPPCVERSWALCRVEGSGGAGGARLRERRARGGGEGAGRGARERRGVALARRPGRPLGRGAGDARAPGLGGRLRRAGRRPAAEPPTAGAVAARRGRAGNPGRRRARSSRCRSSRTPGRSCARSRRGSGCSPTTARPG